jgi:hypothetical protein
VVRLSFAAKQNLIWNEAFFLFENSGTVQELQSFIENLGIKNKKLAEEIFNNLKDE